MRLTLYSDYLVRVLIHAALRSPELVTVSEVAETFGVSRHHLVKVVHELGSCGYLETLRGIGGGFRLGRAPEDIVLGDLIRLGEDSATVIDCRECRHRDCPLAPACRLREVLDEASEAFFAVLDRHTLKDLLGKPERLRQLLGIE